MNFFSSFNSPGNLSVDWSVIFNQFLFTISVLAILIIFRLVFFRVLNRSTTLMRENKRRLMVNTNSLLSFIFLLSLTMIWAQELSVLAISFVAIAAALVIATKELILCFTGGIFKATTNLCSIGDRIHIGDLRGDVIDRTLLATKIMEVGPGLTTNHYTGRVVTIPNSLFLTQPTVNESFLKDFVIHSIVVPLSYQADWQKAEEVLLEVANRICSPHLERARSYVDRKQRRSNLETPKVEPRVRISFISKDELHLVLRVTIPSKDLVAFEQQIKRDFLMRSDLWAEKLQNN